MPRKPGTLYILLGLITEPEARMDFVIMYIWVFHRALGRASAERGYPVCVYIRSN